MFRLTPDSGQSLSQQNQQLKLAGGCNAVNSLDLGIGGRVGRPPPLATSEGGVKGAVGRKPTIRHLMTSGLGKSYFSTGSSFGIWFGAGLSLGKYTGWNAWCCVIRFCEMCTIEQHWVLQSWIVGSRSSKTRLLNPRPAVTYCIGQKRMSWKKEPQCVNSV